MMHYVLTYLYNFKAYAKQVLNKDYIFLMFVSTTDVLLLYYIKFEPIPDDQV